MADNDFEEILDRLRKSEDHSQLLTALTEVRRNVEWPKNKDKVDRLRDTGCLKRVVEAVGLPKRAVTDVALSVLGNCCLDSKSARDVMSQYNVLPALSHVLKRHPKEDSVNGRVFRIVGNLCQHKDQWATVLVDKKPQIVVRTVAFLDEAARCDDRKISDATVIMGVRSLRELLNQYTLEKLAGELGVLKTVGMLLIKYSAGWQEGGRGEAVLHNIIKLLVAYSRYRHYPSILELRKTELGDSIVCLSKILMLAPKQVVRIVMNFLRVSQLNSDLPVPEIVDGFVRVLDKDSPTEAFGGSYEECVRCLCQLLDHPGNRSNERCGESVPLLIDILKKLAPDTSPKAECCAVILATLNKFKYDERLVRWQIQCGVLDALLEKLKWLAASAPPCGHPKDGAKEALKRKFREIRERLSAKKIRWGLTSPLPDLERAIFGPSGDDAERSPSPEMRYDLSPCYSSDSEPSHSWRAGLSPSSSPRLSPSSSPRPHDFTMSDSDSDYSPVCSEADPDDFPLSLAAETAEEEKPPSLSQETTNPSVHNPQSYKQGVLLEAVRLLRTYAKLEPPVPQLGDPELLMALIRTCGFFGRSSSSEGPPPAHVTSVVYPIVESHAYLLPLMVTDFVPEVYELSFSEGPKRGCSRCGQVSLGCGVLERLTGSAESEAGKGAIAHGLLRGEASTKQMLALNIPYTIENYQIMSKLMNNCGGLEILVKLLRDDTAELRERCIRGLCVLASRRLDIPSPVRSSLFRTRRLRSMSKWGWCSPPPNVDVAPTVDPARAVIFRLDDGSLLAADRELLSSRSDYFDRMLCGGFKEATQHEIALHNVTHQALRCLLHVIQDEAAGVACSPAAAAAVDEVRLPAHLETIALCDRFLMPDYCVYLADCVQKRRFSPDVLPTIYRWSLESRTNLLRVECVAFALVEDVLDAERLAMFRSLFDLGYTEELVEDIRSLLVRHLGVTPFRDVVGREAATL